MTDLDSFAHDVGKAGFRLTRNIQKDVQQTAFGMQGNARKFASGIGHAPSYPRAIGFDMEYTLTSVGAKVGPDKDGPQGALGNILEYGSANNAPRTHLGPALDIGERDLMDRIEKSVGDLW